MAQDQANHRPNEGRQAVQVVKVHSALPNQIHYGTIQSDHPSVYRKD